MGGVLNFCIFTGSPGVFLGWCVKQMGTLPGVYLVYLVYWLGRFYEVIF